MRLTRIRRLAGERPRDPMRLCIYTTADWSTSRHASVYGLVTDRSSCVDIERSRVCMRSWNYRSSMGNQRTVRGPVTISLATGNDRAADECPTSARRVPNERPTSAQRVHPTSAPNECPTSAPQRVPNECSTSGDAAIRPCCCRPSVSTQRVCRRRYTALYIPVAGRRHVIANVWAPYVCGPVPGWSARGQRVVNEWSARGQRVVNEWATSGQRVGNEWSTSGPAPL